MFDTLLIANRGEIACRIAATARRMGIRTVAVYSDADANAQHVSACDVAVHIGGPEPRESYLRGDVIIEAAKKTGAQAIHPGYGFLAENESFAQACADAGIIFVGPPVESIAAMGSKSAAKALMEAAGVPLVPGYHGNNQDPDFLKQQADQMGYPVLIKASAGGGGKGMRIVDSSEQFTEALLSCKREAAASFSDDTVLIERYLIKPRHIEIQVFADQNGDTVYLFERDCSVQRRHQKVVEEAPAPGMTPERRSAMGEAAVAAARAVNYVGAGTVEFIVEPDGKFYFMEMNTRLQVEHPVTELITGQDLVEWQLNVAAGKPLPLSQEQLSFNGHSLEARIYAENPDNDFLPSIGKLEVLDWPEHTSFSNGDIRVDGGVQQGDTISPYYDPMIAKLIVYGNDRDQAIARMLNALEQVRAVGVHTNISFLHRLVSDESFVSADLDTGLIERRHHALFPSDQPISLNILATAVAALLADQGISSGNSNGKATNIDPWSVNDSWRVSGSVKRTITLREGDNQHQVMLTLSGKKWLLESELGAAEFSWECDNKEVTVQLDSQRYTASTAMVDHSIYVFERGVVYVFNTQIPGLYGDDESDAHQGGLTAPMPGKIISIDVNSGDQVEAGQRLLVMEAMKMEHTISAPYSGVVTELFFEVGDQVVDGAELIALEPSE